MIPHSNHMLRFKNNIHVEVDYIQKFNSHRIGINQGSRPIFLLALRSLQVVFKQQYRALMERSNVVKSILYAHTTTKGDINLNHHPRIEGSSRFIFH